MESLQRVLGSFPSYMIWDDHDIFDGWGSDTEAELVAQVSNSWHLENTQENLRMAGEMFRAATQVYQEYQHYHNPPGDLNFPKGLKQFNYSFPGTKIFQLTSNPISYANLSPFEPVIIEGDRSTEQIGN